MRMRTKVLRFHFVPPAGRNSARDDGAFGATLTFEEGSSGIDLRPNSAQSRTVICPHCSHKIPLTWTRYFSSLSGHHFCPGCGKKFKIAITASSVLLLLAVTVIAAATPTVVAFFLAINFWYTIAAYVLVLVGVVIPFDRWLDNKIRPTKPIK